MRILNRIGGYLLLLAAYWSAVLLFLRYEISISDNLIVSIVILLTPINLLYTFIVLKMHWIVNVVCSAAVPCLSLSLTFFIIDQGWYPSSDFYGITTAIACLGIFSVLLWELLYQVKIRFPLIQARG